MATKSEELIAALKMEVALLELKLQGHQTKLEALAQLADRVPVLQERLEAVTRTQELWGRRA